MITFLCVGLGNPDSRYHHTRHNLGRVAIERWVGERAPWRARTALHASTAELFISETERVVALVPELSMNVSGQAVAAAAQEFSIEPQEIIIVHDELELPFGEVMFQEGGSAHGHNGVRSLHEALGSMASTRLRLGIGRPPEGLLVSDFVLQLFTPEEREQLPTILEQAAGELEKIIQARQSRG